MRKIYSILWIFCVISIFLYSFTQIDLGLTLIKYPAANFILKNFQYVGYFTRPISTYLYLAILVLFYISYIFILKALWQEKKESKSFYKIIIFTAVTLIFTYPAFSYDIFNYMFDAKTIVLYHENPWIKKPLDFPGDPWLAFMHWTHRPSVYPPGWILLSIPFYFIGMNYFIVILYSFKLLMALSYVGSIFLLDKILTLLKSKNRLFYVGLFAFNPLVIIESLVSGHNDIVMMFFALFSVWLFMKGKRFFSIISVIFSGFIKYLGVVFLPVYLIAIVSRKKLEVIHFRMVLLLMIAGFFYVLTKMEIQPWYLIWIIPIVCLSQIRYSAIIITGVSFGLMLRYAPFLFLGNWNEPVPYVKSLVTNASLLATSLIVLFLFVRNLWIKKQR